MNAPSTTVLPARRVRISAVVPVYNSEPWLRAALDSLLKQTESFHEIVAVNDGSTDGSLDVLRAYECDGLVRVLTQDNHGQGAARNVGARHASGDWIYFFDSDDVASPVLVATLSEHLQAGARELDAVLFSGEAFVDPGVDSSALARTPTYQRPALGHFSSLHAATLALEACTASFVSPCLYVLSSGLVQRVPLRFADDYHEDDNFYLDLVASAGPALVIADVLFRRRVRAGSVTSSPKSVRHLRGYLGASMRARAHARRTPDAARRQYFRRKAIEYYLAALALSRSIEGGHPLRSLLARLLALPTWRLTPSQYAEVLVGGRPGRPAP